MNPWRLEAASERHLTVSVRVTPGADSEWGKGRGEQTASSRKETSRQRHYLLLTPLFSPSVAGKETESLSLPIVASDGKRYGNDK